jgi:ribosomal protein S8E
METDESGSSKKNKSGGKRRKDVSKKRKTKGGRYNSKTVTPEKVLFAEI